MAFARQNSTSARLNNTLKNYYRSHIRIDYDIPEPRDNNSSATRGNKRRSNSKTTQKKVNSRVKYNSKQLAALKQEFSRNKYPSSITKSELAIKCNVSQKQINGWFQTRRKQNTSRDVDNTSFDLENIANTTNSNHNVNIKKEVTDCTDMSDDEHDIISWVLPSGNERIWKLHHVTWMIT